jgi:hypothetical protein
MSGSEDEFTTGDLYLDRMRNFFTQPSLLTSFTVLGKSMRLPSHALQLPP